MFHRNGIQQRRSSWQDGVSGTNCPISPRRNFTYVMQVKDQIGSFFYFPSLAFHKAAGGFGGIIYNSKSAVNPCDIPSPAGDFSLLIGDWYKSNHSVSTLYMLQKRKTRNIYILLTWACFVRDWCALIMYSAIPTLAPSAAIWSRPPAWPRPVASGASRNFTRQCRRPRRWRI